MDEIAKSLERKLELGLSEKQSQNIDLIFQEFMREYHFPKSHPVNDTLLRFKYFRKALNVLTNEQLEIYRRKKLEAKSKSKVKKKEKDDRQLEHLRKEYRDVNLTSDQLELVNKTRISFRKQIYELEELQQKILAVLQDTISNDQRVSLDSLHAYQLKRNRRGKAESIKNRYRYLNLRFDQAKEISILEEMERKRRRENRYEFPDRYLIKPEFKEILTEKQFELYSAHQQEQKNKSMQSQIRRDATKVDELTELQERVNFYIENQLPGKCEIAKQLLETANKDDLDRITLLRKKYDEIIDETITIQITRHEERYGSRLPNRIKLIIMELAMGDINPSPSLMTDIDFNKNEFTSIQFSKEQESELESLKHKLRDYNIARLEKKLKGSYGGLTSIGRKREVPKFLELYSILLLDDQPEKNIEKMNQRQLAHGIKSKL